jgi:peptidoglycan/xylan/chitin deacetylase (PgdA/CDA1 family)
MQSRGYTATCFIPSAQVGTAGKLTWDNIREIERAGWTIGNHTRNHSNFGTETLVNIEADIKNGKSDLIANGLNPKNAEIFAFPASTVPYIERTASIVSENCIFARTTSAYPQSGILSSPINPIMSAPCYGAGTGVTPAQFDARLVKTIADKSSMILLIHDIGGIGSAVQWTDQELADFFVIIDAYVGAGSLDVVCLGNEFRKLNISLEV